MSNSEIPKMDAASATRILENVFDECEMKPNSVPIEALSAYSSYRKERFALQKTIIVIAMILFLLLPFLFISPSFKVGRSETGERNLPVYTVDVGSVLPVRSVVATLDGKPLPVYEKDAKHYTIEPTRNGRMIVKVGLVNYQKTEKQVNVTSVDSEGPDLVSSRADGKKVYLKLADKGIGVDFDAIYALSESGKHIRPLDIDEKNSEVVFGYPKGKTDIYVPDNIGNILHLSLKLK